MLGVGRKEEKRTKMKVRAEDWGFLSFGIAGEVSESSIKHKVNSNPWPESASGLY
jgi:hypothetical protein